jgi:hypothetical protein
LWESFSRQRRDQDKIRTLPGIKNPALFEKRASYLYENLGRSCPINWAVCIPATLWESFAFVQDKIGTLPGIRTQTLTLLSRDSFRSPDASAFPNADAN